MLVNVELVIGFANNVPRAILNTAKNSFFWGN